ncbi:MAG: permease-like cell division protein FtsX [bacterium]
MMINGFFYNIRQGFKNIWRNRMFSIASISTMAACIFIFGIFFSILMNVNSMVRTLEEEVGITVLFDEGISEKRIQKIGETIKTNEHVVNIKFTSAEEAWENFKKEYFADHPEYADSFSEDNPLANSASYTIHVDQVENQAKVVSFIEAIKGVRQVNHSDQAVKTLMNFNSLLTVISMVIIIILLIIAIFLISNTVSVGINVRRPEIKIMKLIGATDSFVRAPFVVEGAIIGLVGAALPLLILFFTYDKLISILLNHFGVLSNLANALPTVNQVFSGLLPIGLALGLGIGLIGSILTIRRHLKV